MKSCERVAKLKSESFHRTLSLREKLGITLHFWMCKPCIEFTKQMDFIHKATQRMVAGLQQNRQDMPTATRKRIREKLQNQIDKNPK